jgi:hypothetical protein
MESVYEMLTELSVQHMIYDSDPIVVSGDLHGVFTASVNCLGR